MTMEVMQQEAAVPGAVKPRLIPGSDEQGEIAASPEEEAVLDQVVSKAMTMIHGRKSRDAVIQSLHNPREEVAAVVGRVGANILMAVSEQKGVATGVPVDPEILREAAGYVIPELMQVGVAAGIFPFEAPDDDAEEVGAGTTEFDQQSRLAMLEAVKVYGESQLRQPGSQAKSEAAGDEWARGISQEVQDGTADSQYMAVARPTNLINDGGAQ
jgi:hypothetical protein